MSTTDTEGRTLIRYAADLVVICGYDVLLIRRGTEPYAGRLALPGGHVDAMETSRAAAVRELAEETGVNIDPARLRPLGVYDDPDRDPRARVVAAAYAATIHNPVAARAGDDALDAIWVDIAEALDLPLAFDHRRILAAAYDLFVDGQLDHF